MTFEAVQDRILAELPQLSSQLRKAARFLVDHPDEVALASMRVLATHADVTPTTFVRLARRLGFESWAALRRPYENRLRSRKATFSAKAEALVLRRAPEAIFADSLKAAAGNSLAALSANPPEGIARACLLLERAQSVRVAGFRSSRAPAHALVYLYGMFRSDVALLGSESGHLETELAALTGKEALVALGFHPYSRELGPVAEAARRRTIPLIAIVDSVAAPIASGADVTLRFSIDSPSFFPSLAASMAVVEALAATLLARSGSDAVERVRRTETELRMLGAYLEE